MIPFASSTKPGRWVCLGVRSLLVYLLLLTFAPVAHAQEPDSPDAPDATAALDDATLEVGFWYVNDYEDNYQKCPGMNPYDVFWTSNDVANARYWMTNPWYIPGYYAFPTPPWKHNYTWSNSLAWEEDWKSSAMGGAEESWIDNVDLAYFAGRGGVYGFFFGRYGNAYDDCELTWNDAYGSWGTRDNDWIVLAAHNVLMDSGTRFHNWANAMNGTRLLIGVATHPPAGISASFAWHQRWGATMTQAWFRAFNERSSRFEAANILAEDGAYFNDRWYNHNSPTVVDNTFSWWVHNYGTPVVAAASLEANEAAAKTLSALGGEMPIFAVEPLSLEEAQGAFAQVANAFALTTTVPITQVSAASVFGAGSSDLLVSADGTLLMDAAAGLYDYVDPANLWNGDRAFANAALAASGEEVRAITQEEARAIAEEFLAQTGLQEDDAAYAGTGSDVLSTAAQPDPATGQAAETLQEITTNFGVNFIRQLVFEPALASAEAQQALTFTIVGPGSIQVVQVDATVPFGVSAAEVVQETVVGGQGGWRQVAPALAADGSNVTATMLPTSTIATLFAEAEERVTLDSVGVVAPNKTILSFTPTYYEGPMGMSMDQLIPVYVLDVESPTSVTTTEIYQAYVPVNATYMAPYAEILAPADTSMVHARETITLTAADASLTLAELGYDASLTFPLGTGDADSYTYDWYLNVISDTMDAAGNGKIGSGLSVNVPVPNSHPEPGKPVEMKFILVVTDTLKNGDPKVAQDELVIQVFPNYLPTVGGGD